ncbi:hypothetical protein LCGC14_1027070 [marine sediment metagenome]|uniref:Uncharacterized protein n=1 Tax=marine sediment metagenome TaxID=412755 RepID=A0A0F9NHG6_9ZZZZ
MKDLVLKSEGVRGGRITQFTKGWASLCYGADLIEVENFEGMGDNYKQREQARIYIQLNGKRYLFSFKSLQKQLDKK